MNNKAYPYIITFVISILVCWVFAYKIFNKLDKIEIRIRNMENYCYKEAIKAKDIRDIKGEENKN